MRLIQWGIHAAVTMNGAPPVTYAEVSLLDAGLAEETLAREWAFVARASDLQELRQANRPSIPYLIDARLLATACKQLNVVGDDQLDFDARAALRNGFWKGIDDLGLGW